MQEINFNIVIEPSGKNSTKPDYRYQVAGDRFERLVDYSIRQEQTNFFAPNASFKFKTTFCRSLSLGIVFGAINLLKLAWRLILREMQNMR